MSSEAGFSMPKRVLYVTHRASSSPEEEWCAYLSQRGAQVHLIGHPFPYKKPNASHWITWDSGKPVRNINLGFHIAWGPDLLFFLEDFLLNFIVFLIPGLKPVDLCISANPLNTCSLLLFRKLGFIRKLVHYTIDYTPLRFRNRFLNGLYHFLDRRACYHSDNLWVLSGRMMEARAKNGVDLGRCAPVVVVPMGADLSRIQVPDKPDHLRRLLYMGHLREHQGLELCVEVFAELRKDFPDLTWEIIGEGRKRPEIEKRLRELGVEAAVIWHGFKPDHRDVETILCKGGIGLALYEPSQDTFTTYADPGKPKIYLACGLPVLITSVPAVAEEIEREGAGAVVPYEREAAVEVLKDWLRDPVKIPILRRSALRLARNYDWPSIFETALKETLKVRNRERSP